MSVIKDFAQVGSLSITELCIVFMVMRDGSEPAPYMAEQFECWFDMTVGETDIMPALAGMIERKWIEPNPAKTNQLRLTAAGEGVAWKAFQGFVRFVDEGNHSWDPFMMWRLAQTRPPSNRHR
jgi:hypothetical protein